MTFQAIGNLRWASFRGPFRIHRSESTSVLYFYYFSMALCRDGMVKKEGGDRLHSSSQRGMDKSDANQTGPRGRREGLQIMEREQKGGLLPLMRLGGGR